MPEANENAGTRPPAPDDLVDTLVQTTFATMAILNRLCAANDLSPTLLRVLAILWDRRVRITALADYLGLDKSTMTGMVARAEKRGLLRRAPNPTDGRAVDVYITPDGATLAAAIRTQLDQALAPMTTRLTCPDRDRLQTLLQRMLES